MSIHFTDLGNTPSEPIDLPALSLTGSKEISRLLESAQRHAESSRSVALDYISQARALLSTPAPVCKPGGLAPWQIKRVERIIDDRLEHGVTLSELAGPVGLSNGYFCKAFKTSFGTSPYSFLQARRVERAKDLILGNDRSLSEIALDCGLCDQAHLSRVFRKFAGVSPSQWRKMYLQEGRH